MDAPTVVAQPSRAGEAQPVAGGVERRRWWQRALGSPFFVATLACLGLAAISAAILPTVPSYDPWAWIVWGREVVDPHLSFATGGGPSWKPLPVIFTTVFALFGGAAPTLWVIVARAGGLLGLVAGYRLAARLAGGGAWGAVAGVLAAAGIVLTQEWGYYMFRGTSEPLLIATSLWAIDRHLAGRRTSAFVLAVATGLLRPEAWPFIGIYAIWLWIREPRLRPLIVAGLVSIPFFWFVPPWIGSGQPFLAATHAQLYNGHLGKNRFVTVVRRGANLQVTPALIGAIIAVLFAGVGLRRRSPNTADVDRPTLWLAALVVAWWVVVVGLTLDGYPGLERFYLPAAALTCSLAGAGYVRLARLSGSVVASRPRPSLAVAATAMLVLIAVSVPFTTMRISVLRAQEPIAARAVTRLDQLSAAVAAVGGHRRVYPCPSSLAAVNHSVQTALAWKLRVTLKRVSGAMTRAGVMFRGPHDSIDGIFPPINASLTQRQLLASTGVWRVYRMTAPGVSTACVGG
jgi:hypothetical protein